MINIESSGNVYTERVKKKNPVFCHTFVIFESRLCLDILLHSTSLTTAMRLVVAVHSDNNSLVIRCRFHNFSASFLWVLPQMEQVNTLWITQKKIPHSCIPLYTKHPASEVLLITASDFHTFLPRGYDAEIDIISASWLTTRGWLQKRVNVH